MSNNNPTVFETITNIQSATMSPSTIKASGAGKAYQAVAQSTAIAVQGATDHLRNMSNVSATAVGMAMAQLLADPENIHLYEQVLDRAQGITDSAASQFKTIGENAADVLQQFPAT